MAKSKDTTPIESGLLMFGSSHPVPLVAGPEPGDPRYDLLDHARDVPPENGRGFRIGNAPGRT
jgi:hypothetical protein